MKYLKETNEIYQGNQRISQAKPSTILRKSINYIKETHQLSQGNPSYMSR